MLQNGTGGWVGHLMRADYGNHDQSQFDRVAIAGLPALLLTNPSPESQKLRNAPRNFRWRQIDNLHVAVPLSPDLVITFKGTAQLSAVEELLKKTDLAGLNRWVGG